MLATKLWWGDAVRTFQQRQRKERPSDVFAACGFASDSVRLERILRRRGSYTEILEILPQGHDEDERCPIVDAFVMPERVVQRLGFFDVFADLSHSSIQWDRRSKRLQLSVAVVVHEVLDVAAHAEVLRFLERVPETTREADLERRGDGERLLDLGLHRRRRECTLDLEADAERARDEPHALHQAPEADHAEHVALRRRRSASRIVENDEQVRAELSRRTAFNITGRSSKPRTWSRFRTCRCSSPTKTHTGLPIRSSSMRTRERLVRSRRTRRRSNRCRPCTASAVDGTRLRRDRNVWLPRCTPPSSSRSGRCSLRPFADRPCLRRRTRCCRSDSSSSRRPARTRCR